MTRPLSLAPHWAPHPGMFCGSEVSELLLDCGGGSGNKTNEILPSRYMAAGFTKVLG